MLSKKSKAETKLSAKDILVTETMVVLSNALTGLKEQLGEKKFEKRIMKAAKLFTQGVKPIAESKAVVPKTPPKKTRKIPAAKNAEKVSVKKAREEKKSI